AIMAGKTEVIDQSLIDEYCEYFFQGNTSSAEDGMYWDFDEAQVSKIRDSIHEYHFYDEELDQKFTVHVTTPPSYDASKRYPALVLTDAVWRFNDVAALFDAMEKGEAAPQFIITIGFEYDTDGWDNK
ncbi:hypothetical protein RCJ22_28545, partial [Vibrio sp. FNV 38]|nr:hypothetical protein [Vibrio sp. FNV 38]